MPPLYLTGPHHSARAGRQIQLQWDIDCPAGSKPSSLLALAGESAASVMRLWLLGVGKGAAQPVAFPAISEGLVLLLDSVHVSTC